MAWYDDFFDDTYMELERSRFTPEQTLNEVEFVISKLDLKPGARILDMCCGHGRHSLELARRGYQVTGVDRNQAFIAAAAQAALSQNLEVDWQVSDMREFQSGPEYDVALNLFFAWGYLESEEEDLQALRKMAGALRPGGRFLIEYQNRELVLQHLQNAWRRLPDDAFLLREYKLDLATSRLSGNQIVIRSDGQRVERRFEIRLYSCTELNAMLKEVGLTPMAAFGNYTGHPYSLNSPMLLVIAGKQS